MTTSGQRDLLRSIARDALRATLADEEFGIALPDGGPLSEPGSCFVTLRRHGRLRGCIGLIGDRFPLAETVRRAAVQALHDPRFPPPSPSDQEEDLSIEISILGPIRPVESPDEVEPGRHGVHLSRGARSAIFLPQVAGEQGWDRERLLSELARKAGLAEDAWRRPGTEIGIFEAEVF